MERLTKRIHVPKEEREVVVFTQGKYSDTIPAEMTHEDIRKVLRKLAEYEDAEGQGLLLRLPCKVDSTVYLIKSDGKIVPRTADMQFLGVLWEDYGKEWFLTQAEAEQKLKEMESGNNGTME